MSADLPGSPGVEPLAEPDDWPCRAPLATLRARAAMLARIRSFFAEAGVLEVETPILSAAGATDPTLTSLRSSAGFEGPAAGSEPSLYLQTSPEFPMKRLLACGSGPIYQVCKVFRWGERGRRHHPEFTLLEWYRPGWEYRRLMDEVAALVARLLGHSSVSVEWIRYRDLFRDRLQLDPWTARPSRLRAAAMQAGIADADRLDLEPDAWLDLLLTQCLEPHLGRNGMTFLYEYPPSQAALSRLGRPAGAGSEDAYAERFELYLEGIELANGFGELVDAREQGARFDQDLHRRRCLGMAPVERDERLLAALRHGMPDCSGVALGLDRLLMIAVGASRIDEVLAFPIERA